METLNGVLQYEPGEVAKFAANTCRAAFRIFGTYLFRMTTGAKVIQAVCNLPLAANPRTRTAGFERHRPIVGLGAS